MLGARLFLSTASLILTTSLGLRNYCSHVIGKETGSEKLMDSAEKTLPVLNGGGLQPWGAVSTERGWRRQADGPSNFPVRPRTGPCVWYLRILLQQGPWVFARTESFPLTCPPAGQLAGWQGPGGVGSSPGLWPYIHPVPEGQGVGRSCAELGAGQPEPCIGAPATGTGVWWEQEARLQGLEVRQPWHASFSLVWPWTSNLAPLQLSSIIYKTGIIVPSNARLL